MKRTIIAISLVLLPICTKAAETIQVDLRQAQQSQGAQDFRTQEAARSAQIRVQQVQAQQQQQQQQQDQMSKALDGLAASLAARPVVQQKQ